MRGEEEGVCVDACRAVAGAYGVVAEGVVEAGEFAVAEGSVEGGHVVVAEVPVYVYINQLYFVREGVGGSIQRFGKLRMWSVSPVDGERTWNARSTNSSADSGVRIFHLINTTK